MIAVPVCPLPTAREHLSRPGFSIVAPNEPDEGSEPPVLAFLRQLWGEGTGYVVVARGLDGYWNERGRYDHKKWEEQPFRWPDQEGELLAFIAGPLPRGFRTADWYVAPALFGRPMRRQEAVLWSAVAWLDADGAGPPEELPPSILVESGTTRHYHAYWLLEAPLPREEIERINQGLAYRLGGDRGKWAANSLLRLPDTQNHKTDPPGPVQIVRDGGPRYRPEDFARCVGAASPPAPALPKMAAGPNGVGGREILIRHNADGEMWRLFTEEGSDDRSRDLFRLARLCAERGVTRKDAYAVLRDAKVNKFAEDEREDEERQLQQLIKKVWEPAEVLAGQMISAGDPPRYAVRGGALGVLRHERRIDEATGEVDWREVEFRPLGTFAARVVRDIVTDDGEGGQARQFVIAGETQSGRAFRLEIDAGEYTVPERLRAALQQAGGTQLVIDARAKGDLAPAILSVSDDVAEERVYAHTGWATIDGADVFLAPGGSVIPAGVPAPEVRLPGAGQRYGLRAGSDDEVRAAARLLLDHLLEVFDHRVTYPAVAHAFLPVFQHRLPVKKKYMLHLAGETGSKKTAFACALLALYGDFIDEQPPTSWQSTVNAIEGIGHALKDVLYLVDDYKQGTVKPWQVTQLIQRYADGAGRDRLTSDARLQQTKSIRATMLMTGEDVPTGEASVLARLLVLRVGRGDCREEHLSAVQRGAGLLPTLLRAFVEYLRDDPDRRVADEAGRLEERRDRILGELRRVAPGATNPGRVAMNLAMNETAWALLVGFLEHLGAIDRARGAQLRDEYLGLQHRVAGEQAALVTEERASAVYRRTLAALLASERAVLRPLDRDLWDDAFADQDSRAGARLVGWEDAEGVYLIPDAAYTLVVSYLRESGQTFPFGKQAVHEQLASDGALVRTGRDGGRPIVKKIGKSSKRVLHLPAGYFDERAEEGAGDAPSEG